MSKWAEVVLWTGWSVWLCGFARKEYDIIFADEI